MGARFGLGIDLGGTSARAALVADDGRMVAHAVEPTLAEAGPEAVIGQVLALIAGVRAAGEGAIAGVGVGCPGPLDPTTGVVIAPPTLKGWLDVPLKAILEARLGLPAVVENDAHAAAYGEWRFGGGQGTRHMVYVTVSTGIGGGVINDGRLLHGHRGLASHVGHMAISMDGPVCFRGKPGCWEAWASGTALGRFAREAVAGHPASLLARLAEPAALSARHVVEAARQGDALALRLIADEARYLGFGIVNLMHLHAPELVLVGGGVSEGFDLLEPGIRRVIAERALEPFVELPVRRAALGIHAGVVGAAALALDLARPAAPRLAELATGGQGA